MLVILLLLVLSSDLAWDDAGHGHCEDALLDGQEKHDPVITVRLVLDHPGFVLRVPGVTAPHSIGNFIMS